MGLASWALAADVDRIREKALELEQNLISHQFEVEVRGKEADSERVYKDFAFLLTDSQVETATKAGDTRLVMFLQESRNNLELSSYIDDLHNKQTSETVDFDGVEKTQGELLKLLGESSDAATRRKIYSTLKSTFELDGIFRNQIVTRQIELAQEAGYADFADYFAQRENLDLDAVAAEAQAFLTESQALYDELFSAVAMERLGEESRKVKFLDFPFLLTPAEPAPAMESLKTAAEGLGLGALYNAVTIDAKTRPGRVPGARAYPMSVPDQVSVGVTPTGTIQDYSLGLYALGEAGVYALSKQSGFAEAYLVPGASSATLGYLVRAAGDRQGTHSQTFLAYCRLFEARVLAAQVIYEIALYRADPEVDRVFKETMREACGSRLSSSDVKRRFEYATALQSVSRFVGMMAAHTVCQQFASQLGEDWYQGGKAGETVASWCAQGGTLTVAGMLGGAAPDRNAILAHIELLK